MHVSKRLMIRIIFEKQFEWTLQSSLNPTETVKIEVYDEERIGKNRYL